MQRLWLLGLEGWFARWRGHVIEAASAAEDRMHLACLEWQGLKRHLQQLLVLTIAVGALTVVALIMLSLAVLVHFWESPKGKVGAWLVGGLWLAGWFCSLAALGRGAQRTGNGLALTRRELAQDWRDIKERLSAFRFPLPPRPSRCRCRSRCGYRRRRPR